MGELNREALQAATGAFMDRLTDKPTTGDLLAALRFALEAYESVRVAPAPASQQEASGWELEAIIAPYLLQGMPSGTVIGNPLWWAARIAAAVERELTSRAQRTNESEPE